MVDRLTSPIDVGGHTLPNRVFLAPLAGVSDVPFRRICQEFGCGLTSVEMLSATALLHGANRTLAMAQRHEDESVLMVQLTGPDAETIASGVRVLSSLPFDLVDINMGCPVRKIVTRGCGAALLRDPVEVGRIVTEAKAATSRAVTVKIRVGLSRATLNVEANAARIARAGAAMLTIHGRTKEESYKDPVDYDLIARGIASARGAASGPIVTVGNGDVFGIPGARRMVERTDCDAVMVSRGALGNPWVFEEILGKRHEPPTVLEWRDVVLRHLSYHAAHYTPDRIASVLFRKHLLWYLHGFPGVKKMRDACSVVSTASEARERIVEFAASIPPGTRRYLALGHQGTGRPEAGYDPKHEMDRKLDRGVAGDHGDD